MATTTDLVMFGEVPSLASQTLCPVCYNSFDTFARNPKVLGCGHTLCLFCLDKILNGAGSLKCPMCQTVMNVPTGDAKSVATNYDLRRVIADFDNLLSKREIGMATCCECKMHSDEKGFRVCVECSSMNGPHCDPTSGSFDINQLEDLTICAGCIIEKHSTPGHLVLKLVPFRIARDVQDMDKFYFNISKEIHEMKQSLITTEKLVVEANELVVGMISSAAKVDSSIILSDMKKSVESNSKHMKTALNRLINGQMKKFNSELERQMVLIKAEKAEFEDHVYVEAVKESSLSESAAFFAGHFKFGLNFVAQITKLSFWTLTDRIRLTWKNMRSATNKDKPHSRGDL